jgi:two-component system nitrogen regulation sensor histidine kinase NtrY
MSNFILGLRKKPGFKRLLFALFFAAVCTYLLTQLVQPYEFVVIDSIENSDDFNAFHDFDNDGFSETMEFRYSAPSNYYIYIRNWNGGVIDQTNYTEPVRPTEMFFDDITGDHFDEVIAITQKDDSLFLYVHDIIRKRSIISRAFIISSDQNQIKDRRGMAVFLGCVGDPQVYGNKKVLIFAVRTNSFPAYLPRSVYVIDLESGKILREFKTHSCLTWLFTYDLTGNGIEEIIATGAAYGNMHYPARYRDDTCWLFVLDQELNPIFEPLSFLEYPAELTCVPVQAGSERYLLAMSEYNGDKKITSMMYLIDAQGKIQLHKPNPSLNALLNQPIVDMNINPSEIYTWKGKNTLIRLDHNLEIIRQKETPFEQIRTLFMEDMDLDDNPEIFCQAKNQLLVFNNEFKFLASREAANPGVIGKPGFIRLTGPGNQPELGIHAGRNYYHFRLSRNNWYSFLPLIFILVLLFSYGLTMGAGHIVTRLNLYLRYFRLCFFNTTDSLLIADSGQKLVFVNGNVKHLLQLPHDPDRGVGVYEIFRDYPAILDKFSQCFDQNRSIQEKITIVSKDTSKNIHLLIEPMRFIYRDATTYLIKLSEPHTEPDSQKIHSWSRAVQKMAHDIKTPLSTVALNLKALQMRLSKLQLPETERTDLNDDIRMMQTELENIQIMTRNFLKFSNLDRPHFQAFNITDIFQTAVEKYKPYLNENLNIQINPDKDLKPVWADPQQIEMVFHILLENALAAIQGRGLISISVTLAQFLDTSFTEFLEIEVADTGPGIKKEDMAKIFEPYFSTKSSGTGMGLAIAKKIIEDHGCTIEVYSKAGFGAVFRFTLPVLVETEQYE